MNRLVIFVGTYIIISLIIGVADVLANLEIEKEYFKGFPNKIEYYVDIPERIYGIHNWVLLPSWIPYLIVKLVGIYS